MTGTLDINLSISGPQGIGKTRFMQRMLPILQESAEDFFEGCGCDLLVTGTESNVQNPEAALRMNIKHLRAHNAICEEAQEKMANLLAQLGGNPEDIEKLGQLNREITERNISMLALLSSLYPEPEVSFDE